MQTSSCSVSLRNDRRPADAGFTLIEALVAMAVLAVGAVSLLTATESNIARINDITDRMTARWVAEYRLQQLRLGLPVDTATVAMMGQEWDVTTQSDQTPDPDLQRVTIRVGQAGVDVQGIVILSGYIETSAMVTP